LITVTVLVTVGDTILHIHSIANNISTNRRRLRGAQCQRRSACSSASLSQFLGIMFLYF